MGAVIANRERLSKIPNLIRVRVRVCPNPGTHEETSEGVTKLVIALPHNGSVTVQLNPYPVIEHPIIRCVFCVNAVLWVGLWKYVATLALTLTLTLGPGQRSAAAIESVYRQSQ